MTTTITGEYAFTGTLVIVERAECHMDFGITPAFQRARRADHKTFYCPNQHSNYYPQRSPEEQLRSQLKRSQAAETHLRDQLQSTEYSRRAEKAAKTRLKNRIAAGQCPCCRRTFQNVARHMAGQHPDFSSTEAGS